MYFKFMRKNCKKMLTELSDYVNIFLACDAHVQCASGSVVEHLLAKEGAAGSIPVSRFFFCNKKGTLTGALFYCKIEPEFRLEGSIFLLPPRSLLLTPSRGVHRTPATRLVLFLTFLGLFCVCTYIWKILKLKHFPKKLIPYIKIGY